MQAVRTTIDGVLVLEPRVFGDARGFFYESYNRQAFAAATGLDIDFVQDNHSKSARNVLRGLALRIADIALDRALQPIGAGIGSLLTGLLSGGGKLLPFANGGILNAPNVRSFASGGVLASSTMFPLSGGLGVAGEAGPEAILPLARGTDGRLGVRAESGRPISVTLNVTTPDAESFRKSETQLTTMLARAVGRGRRGL